MRRLVLPFALVMLFTVAVAASRGGDSSRMAPAITVAPLHVSQAIDPTPDLVAYLASVERQAVGDYLAAVAQAELATFLASIPPPAPIQPQYQAPAPRSGRHSDAWWMGVAQCEQGGRNDPYFGYFSFMDGSQGGRPWADQVAAGNALLAGQASESPAWAPSCVAAGYAASPGG